MPTYHTYNVIPTLPAALEPLREMVSISGGHGNPRPADFSVISIPSSGTGPTTIRSACSSFPARPAWSRSRRTRIFSANSRRSSTTFEKYLGRQDTYGKTGPGAAIKKPVAYFSAEFGFHESIPNYSGGLGILAGDHCKSASDLDLNFVAIGLLYRHGYFKQQIDKDGIQAAISLNQNFHHLPIREVRRGEMKLLISVPILDREVSRRSGNCASGA